MRRVRPAAAACAALLGLTAATAMAQTVPVPRPAPLPKTGMVPPPSSAQAIRPPLALAPAGQPTGTPIPPAARPHPAPSAGAGAYDANQHALVERANAYLTGVQTLVGEFTQIAADGHRTTGKFYLQKPGRVRFEYNPPSPIELIADGQSFVVRNRKLATQDPPIPLSQTPLRFLLAERVDLPRDTNVVGVSSDNQFVTIVIEERQIFAGTHRLTLMFSARDFELKQWTVTDPQGYDTTVTVYNLDKTKRLDPSLFKINYERMLQ